MGVRITDLNCKEVICIGSGQRLGFVTDVEVEMPEGKVVAIVVPCPGKLLGIGSRKDDYVIPWGCIRRIGPDIILVEARPEDCRTPRGKPGLF